MRADAYPATRPQGRIAGLFSGAIEAGWGASEPAREVHRLKSSPSRSCPEVAVCAAAVMLDRRFPNWGLRKPPDRPV
jgi:hypothetical protein